MNVFYDETAFLAQLHQSLFHVLLEPFKKKHTVIEIDILCSYGQMIAIQTHQY